MTLKKRTETPSDPPFRIQVQNRQRRFGLRKEAVVWFCEAALRLMNQAGQELSIAFIGPGEMQTINARYLGHDYATDVLSFCYGDLRLDGRTFLGEILIAPQVAAKQAARFGMHPEKELRKLLVHGILHLLGYNHETDRGQMQRLQAKLLRRRALVNAPSLLDVKRMP
ncbi:MAG: rRNA maturation RNase YbeY [Acidobacteriota bacterium]|nr:rRNA maturation RNase YbeY [Acidobacteriota bacterium]